MVGPGGRPYPGPGGRGPRGPRMNGPQYGAMQVCVAAAPYPSLLDLSLHACFDFTDFIHSSEIAIVKLSGFLSCLLTVHVLSTA